MNSDVHRRLRDLADGSDKEYGKLVQKLLAIAFCEAGAEKVTERCTQGIDLEVALADGGLYALEVKTTQDAAVTFGKKDIAGLSARREKDGYEPYFALLGSRLLDDWIFAHCHAGEIRDAKQYPLTLLRAYRDRALEGVVREPFEAAVVQHGAAAAERGQGALDEILRAYPCYRIA